ncbi:hypothetical protein PG996_015214 [Apiospora saccharicola]|uniref:Uncharacterized protein n=1 Tax=Apiospora saccharicola TaxID=335842 RepID=A0ABR1TMJ8_9PEZI
MAWWWASANGQGPDRFIWKAWDRNWNIDGRYTNILVPLIDWSEGKAWRRNSNSQASGDGIDQRI